VCAEKVQQPTIGVVKTRSKACGGRAFEREQLCRSSGGVPQYAPYLQSIEIAKGRQPHGWNPRRPTTKFAREFRRYIAKRIPNGKEELRIFVSTQTSLDHWHGVDMFLIYRGRIITFDLTVKPGKDEYKANYLITQHDIRSNRFYGVARKVVLDLGGRN
jgi:hypothetical protein